MVTFHAVICLSEAVDEHVKQHKQLDPDDLDQDDYMEPKSEWRPWLQAIAKHIVEIINMPGALGSGHRGLNDKAGVEVFKWGLSEPRAAPLITHAETYMAHCSDMGVELGLPDFNISGRHEALLPTWFHRSAGDAVIPDLEPSAAVGDDIDGVDGPAFHDDPSGKADAPKHFMPNCMAFGGLQHVVNNLCEDVHKGLAHWPTFYTQLKVLEVFLRTDERRQRYIVTCLRGSRLASPEHRFEKFEASLYEGRWHEVLRFLRALKPLLLILSRTWDENKFVRGIEFKGEQRKDQKETQERAEKACGYRYLSPKEVTAALADALFHAYVRMSLLLEEVPEQLAWNSEECVCHGPLVKGMSEHKRKIICL